MEAAYSVWVPFQRVVAFESFQEFAVDLPTNRYTLDVGDKQEQ